MSFLGLIGRAARAGLSTVTGGVSDQILNVVKGLGSKKATAKRAAGGLLTLADQTKAFKAGQKAGSNQYGTVTGSAVVKKVTTQSYTPRVVDTTVRAKPSKPRKRAKLPKAVAKVKRAATGKRTPPKGGLNLKAMAAAWRAAGSPPPWQGWIKSHPIKNAR